MKYTVNTAVSAGASHGGKPERCQDALFTLREGSITVAAVCDGAGSMRYSRQAAQLASRHACTVFSAEFEEIWHAADPQLAGLQAFAQVNDCLRTVSEELELPLDQFDCTLLCAALHEDGRFITCHVGDGVIYRNGEVFSQPENGEASNITSFVCHLMSRNSVRIRFGRLTAPDAALLLTTDGLSDFLTGSPGLLTQLEDAAAQGDQQEMIQSAVSLMAQNVTMDDCSMVILAVRKVLSDSEKRRALLLRAIAEGNHHPLSRGGIRGGLTCARKKRKQDLRVLRQEGALAQQGGRWYLVG